VRRSNPAGAYARRYGARRRRRRSNPNGNGIMAIVMKHALPIAGSLYVSRLVSGKLSGRIPGFDRVPEQFRQPVLAGGLVVVGHIATTKVRPLKKHRVGIMTGLVINAIDKVLGAFAPANVKSMFGISNYGEDIYGPALSDYVAVNGAPPIQDDITLADYVAVDDYVSIGEYDGEGLETELGMMQDLGMHQDLGVEMDLGDFANRRLGGVTRSAMAAPIGEKRYLAPVPARSFTKEVPRFSAGFDDSNKLYTGIFSGGCV